MAKFENDEYRSVEEFRAAVAAFHGACGLLLFAFAKEDCDTKNILLRNFIARTDTMVRGVLQLWDIADFQDCWILNRCLLDRLFHLVHLGETDSHEIFDGWSFCEQYEAQNRVRSDPEFHGALKSQLFTPSPKEKSRYAELSKNSPKWERPKAEVVAKKMNLTFLYKYGYDFGSTHVHPMANDGQQDFFTITKLEPSPDFPDQRSVLSNSILIGSMIIQEALNQSSFQWRRVVYDFLDHLLAYLHDGTLGYQETFLRIAQMAREMGLCEANGHPGESAA
jgi:hypothetical protein